jgi:site-specific DNA recombinase
MLAVAYCRVSTDEQAAEGFSIEGQAEKLRAYAELHDLGDVTVVSDPGWSGKNCDRPGLQQLMTMISAGHVSAVLIWRLDRLSRNLGDLILLADEFGKAGVDLHSFSERIDLSSATGRMFVRPVLPGAARRERTDGNGAGNARGAVGKSTAHRL